MVARPSKWGNPYPVDVYGRDEAIRAELRGRDLACWCRPAEPCHADLLLQIANHAQADDESRSAEDPGGYSDEPRF